MNIAVVLGTSKSDGNTRALVDAFIAESGAKLFDLSAYQISFFDYQHSNQQDDFLPLNKELVGFEHIVCFACLLVFNVCAVKSFL